MTSTADQSHIPPAEIKTPNDGAIYWRRFIGVETLPAISKEKKPVGDWKKYQTSPASDEEFRGWLDNDKFKDGICILTGRVRHRHERSHLYYVKIDGDQAFGIKELLTRNGHTPTIEKVAEKWIVEHHKDNLEKRHFGFYSSIRFPEKITDPFLGLEVRCEDSEGKTNRVIMVTPSIHIHGYHYEIMGTKDPVVLTEPQARELIQHINQICIRNGVEYLTKTGNSKLDIKLKRMIKRLAFDKTIEIWEGRRNDMLIAVADSILFTHSHMRGEEELRRYFDDINEQLCKPPLGDNEVDVLWERALKFVEDTKDQEKANGNGNNGNSQHNSSYSNIPYEEDIHLPDSPEFYGLDEDIYGVLNFNPTVLAVARSKTKQVVKARVVKNEHRHMDGEIDITNNLMWIAPIMDAIPTKVVKNENPIDEKNTTNYTITFTSKGSAKPFRIGPITISKMVEILTDKGRVLKKLAVTDALTSLIATYERSSRIEIDSQIPTPGYYWIDGRIVGSHVTQRLDFDPWNNEDHKREVLECTKIFDEWQQRNKKKIALPTSLKWAALAPFAFITKTRSKGVDKWLPSFYLYQTTDTGKTTLVRDAILAPWGIYSDGENSHIHLKGPGSLDSPSKFGIAASQSTLVILGDEIGNMFNDSNKYGGNNILLEMQKFSVQNKYVRTKFNDDILALASFVYTSNDPPPNDGAARRRFFAIQFLDNEVWTEDEKKDYERWMNEADSNGRSRKERLSVYGDFVASYVIKHPELVIGYSSYSWHEPATTILKEFYKAADIEPPSWLDLLAEQTIVQESREERKFELRGFLRQWITKSYKDNIYAIPDPAFTIDDTFGRPIRSARPPEFKDMLDYCVRNKTVPFIHKCNRNLGMEEDIAITSNIKAEMKKYDKNMPSVTMESIAAKIPGFEYGNRWISEEKIRVICGPRSKLQEYLDYEIREDA